MNTIPQLGLGTFRLQGQQAIDSVRNGLELGYRHIDTAQIYGNEAEVGQALQASGVPRRGRLRHHQDLDREPGRRQADREPEGQPAQAAPGAARPDPDPLAVAAGAVPVAESMQALLEAREQGLTGAIGVSNFTNALLAQAIAAVGAPTSPPTRSSCIPSCRTAAWPPSPANTAST
jgi:2,5-diketo-D-gluconate reductase B